MSPRQQQFLHDHLMPLYREAYYNTGRTQSQYGEGEAYSRARDIQYRINQMAIALLGEHNAEWNKFVNDFPALRL